MNKKQSVNTHLKPQSLSIGISLDNVHLWAEDPHLYREYRERVAGLLSQYKKYGKLSQGEIIDTYIYLHLVLETSLSAFYRTLASFSIKKGIDKIDVDKNIDSISFLDKTIMFIYNSSFNFNDSLIEATEQHKIIGYIKNFNEIRNKLIHGHAIGEGSDQYENIRQTATRSILTPEKLLGQVQLCAKIMEGMQFYFAHLNLNISGSERARLSEIYFNHTFITNNIGSN